MFRPSLQRRSVEKEADGGTETELEADVPQHVGIDCRHHDGRGGEGDRGESLPTDVPAQQVKHAHNGRPHHSGGGSDEQRIDHHPADGHPGRVPSPHQAAGQPGEYPCDDGDVKAGDGDDVGGAGDGEGFLQVSRNATLHAQEDAGEERGGRFVENGTDHPFRTLLQSQQRSVEGIPLPCTNPHRASATDQGVDPLAGQVVPIGKVLPLRRGLQQTRHPEPVAVGKGGVGVHPHQG